ncbi:MAG TPA: hypothetical protein VM101_02115, partial [Flavitalea sp.]|nr:hypothetical protein [Flavitalea sp.]
GLLFIIGAVMMLTFAISCNDSSTKEETKTDSTAVTDSALADTSAMDTAKTKPIVNPDRAATDTSKGHKK